MFCNQCVQTPPDGCTKRGVCGKNKDIASLQDVLNIAAKGISAYAYHARELGYTSEDVDSLLQRVMFSTGTNVNFNEQRFIDLCLKEGEACLQVMELLDRAHVEKFGNPEPTEVTTGTVDGPGILVTGHDLLDLYELLKQTEGRGVNIYTHNEMLPAHGYPEIKKYENLVGNFGGSWVDQKETFENFPGAILANTNCVLPPKDTYKDRIFTCGIAGLEGVEHVSDRNFEPVIKKALKLPELSVQDGDKLTVGFHHSNVLQLAEKIVEAVNVGKIKHFFLIAGCDSPLEGMEYYQELIKMIPQDSVIITLACGKFRYHDITDYGSIDGIPRFIDLGQCNDAYSAAKIATALSEAFRCSVNELPLSIVLSWCEQKAVSILLTLLHLGIKDIRVGPRAPAFVSEGVFNVLQDSFDLKLTGDPKKDLAMMLGG